MIAGTVAGVRVIGAYFPNGQAPAATSSPTRCAGSAALRAWLRSSWPAHPRLALMGDFNIAPEDRDVYDPVAWAGQIHCTPEERAQFQALLRLGLHDAFRLFDQPDKSWSWWDYRNLGVPQQPGPAHRPRPRQRRAEAAGHAPARSTSRRARTNGPSDHAPVIVELAG